MRDKYIVFIYKKTYVYTIYTINILGNVIYK